MINLEVIPEDGSEWWPGLSASQLKVLSQSKCVENVAAICGAWNLTTTDEDLPTRCSFGLLNKQRRKTVSWGEATPAREDSVGLKNRC